MSQRPSCVSGATKAAACLLSAIAIGGCANSTHRVDRPSSRPGHGSLTDHEFNVAVTVARAEAEKEAAELTAATATIGDGTVMDSNVGSACTSGKLLHVKLFGTFPRIQTTGRATDMPDAQKYNEPVGAVLITADPESGKACLISVQVGAQTPEPGAALLLPELRLPAAVPPVDPRASAPQQFTSPPPTTTLNDPVRNNLLAAADAAAHGMGGAAKHVEVVKTTRGKAADLTGHSNLNQSEAVWVVQVSGDHYICGGCTRPAGASAPEGDYITLVLRASDYEGTDRGLGPRKTDLTALGDVEVVRADG